MSKRVDIAELMDLVEKTADGNYLFLTRETAAALLRELKLLRALEALHRTRHMSADLWSSTAAIFSKLDELGEAVSVTEFKAVHFAVRCHADIINGRGELDQCDHLATVVEMHDAEKYGYWCRVHLAQRLGVSVEVDT